MVMQTFPQSPLYGNLTREKAWNDNSNKYDSGDVQGFTNWVRPLYRYTMPIQYMNEIKQSSLWAFWDKVRGTVDPFLLKDPYDCYVNSVLAAASGVTAGSTLYLFDTNSYFVRADTTTISSLSSSLSGYVLIGSYFQYDRDTGLLTATSKATADIWGVRSMQTWKKVKFNSQMQETDVLWNIFQTSVTFIELP